MYRLNQEKRQGRLRLGFLTLSRPLFLKKQTNCNFFFQKQRFCERIVTNINQYRKDVTT